jgi:hypothetical protein
LLVLNTAYDLEKEIEEEHHESYLDDYLSKVCCHGLVPILTVSATSRHVAKTTVLVFTKHFVLLNLIFREFELAVDMF